MMSLLFSNATTELTAIAELSTAKVVFEVLAPEAGVLHHSAGAGALIPAGGIIAAIPAD